MRFKNYGKIRAVDDAKMVRITKEVILDLEEYLTMRSDLFISKNGKVKIYRISGEIIRIDIKESEY